MHIIMQFMQTWVIKASFLMVVLSNTQAFLKEWGEKKTNLLLPSAKPLPEKTLAVPFVFMANDAFVLSVNIMKLYAGQGPGSSLPDRIFNYSLSRASRAVENMFGILSVNSVFYQNSHPASQQS